MLDFINVIFESNSDIFLPTEHRKLFDTRIRKAQHLTLMLKQIDKLAEIIQDCQNPHLQMSRYQKNNHHQSIKTHLNNCSEMLDSQFGTHNTSNVVSVVMFTGFAHTCI